MWFWGTWVAGGIGMYAVESLRGIGVRAPTDLREGGGSAVTYLPEKNTHDDRMATQIAVKTSTFTILMPNKKNCHD